MEKLLIYVVTYNHEKFIEKPLDRIDKNYLKIMKLKFSNDDSSKDDTLKIIKSIKDNFNEKENLQFYLIRKI